MRLLATEGQSFDLGKAQTQRRFNTLRDLVNQKHANDVARIPQRNELADLKLDQARMQTGAMKDAQVDAKLLREGQVIKSALTGMLKRNDPNAYQTYLQHMQKRGVDVSKFPQRFDPNWTTRMLDVTTHMLKVAEKAGLKPTAPQWGINPATGKEEQFYLNANRQPVFTGVEKFRAPQSKTQQKIPASIQEVNWLNAPNRTPEEIQNFWRTKRTQVEIKDRGDAWVAIDKLTGETLSVTPKEIAPDKTPEHVRNTTVATEAGKAQVGLETEKQEAAKKSEKALAALEGVDKLIEESTGSWGGTALDIIASAFGHATEGAIAVGKLKVLQANLMLSQPRMEGPQSDKDVQLYRDAAGQIGDPTVPNKIKLAAVETIRRLHKKYTGVQDDPLNLLGNN